MASITAQRERWSPCSRSPRSGWRRDQPLATRAVAARDASGTVIGRAPRPEAHPLGQHPLASEAVTAGGAPGHRPRPPVAPAPDADKRTTRAWRHRRQVSAISTIPSPAKRSAGGAGAPRGQGADRRRGEVAHRHQDDGGLRQAAAWRHLQDGDVKTPTRGRGGVADSASDRGAGRSAGRARTRAGRLRPRHSSSSCVGRGEPAGRSRSHHRSAARSGRRLERRARRSRGAASPPDPGRG